MITEVSFSNTANLEDAVQGTVFTATWREGLLRPLGGLLDVVEELAAWLQPREPELLQRFAFSLVNVLYPWRSNDVGRPVGELRAGLADFVLRGDQTLIHQFFQKRNVRPQILSYLVHFMVEALDAIARSTPAPVYVCLKNINGADSLAASALQLLSRYLGTRSGQKWRVAGVAAAAEDASIVQDRFSPKQRDALAVATIFGLPFRLSDWTEMLPPELRTEAESSIDQFVSQGMLRRSGADRLRFSQADLARSLDEHLDRKRRQELHAMALESEESGDPFIAAWHAEQSGRSDELRERYVRAMERAWAVSAYDCAITFAELAIAAPSGSMQLDGDLLLGVLNYEAECYEEADRLLTKALDHPPAAIGRSFIEYLLGYNAVFGIHDFKKGIRILTPVFEHYEQIGDQRGAAYVRNTLAFAHFRSRQVGEAIDLEELNLSQLSRSEVSDSFLTSVLQLNLGRLYRNTGEAERALELLRRGLEVQKLELSAHVLLLFYATVGSLQFSQGDYRAALSAYQQSFELVRDMQLDGVKDQVLAAFSRGVPELPFERTTRGDELLYYLHFHLGLACRRLGLEERAAAFLAAIRHQANLLGEQTVEAVEAAFAAANGAPLLNSTAREDFDLVAEEELNSAGDLLRRAAAEFDLAGAIADLLEAGKSVAILRPRDLGIDSIVLYDPRLQDRAELMTSEIGGSHIARATAAFLLPEAQTLFSEVASLPLVQQSATLKPEHRAAFPALVPVRLGVQVLSSTLDEFLFELVSHFAARTGVGLVAASPFHLWRRDLVTTPHQAIRSFLVSSIDALVLGDRLVVKTHGATAVENLLPFRPRVSEEALVFRGATENGKENLLIRIKRRGGYATDDLLKLHPEMSRILDLCDGTRTVAEVLERLGGSRMNEKICGFLRNLWRRGALSFDDPLHLAESAGELERCPVGIG